MSEWVETTLGEVLALDIDAVPVQPATSYAIVGVLNRGRGLLHRDSMLGSATSYNVLTRVRANQVVYSKLKAFEGAITVAPEAMSDSFASQEFPTFTCGERLLPAYMRLLTTTTSFWDALQNLSTGMGGRRERVKPADFLTLHLALPPVAEQRRIVDVMGAVDAQAEALSDEVAIATQHARLLAEDLLTSFDRQPLGARLESIVGGRSPMTTGAPPSPSEEGVLKVSAVTPFRFVAEESKALLADTLMPPAARVQPGDVLITRANTPDRVGAVCRVPHDVREGLYLCDKTLRLTPSDSLDADFLVVAMALASSRQHLTGAATGTSASMFNISQDKIRATPVPLPAIEDQRRIAATVLAARRAGDVLSAELARLRMFRSTLLTALLNQEIEIPESYDSLLEEAHV